MRWRIWLARLLLMVVGAGLVIVTGREVPVAVTLLGMAAVFFAGGGAGFGS